MRSAPASVLVITGLFYVTPPPPPGVRWSADWVTRIIIAECHHKTMLGAWCTDVLWRSGENATTMLTGLVTGDAMLSIPRSFARWALAGYQSDSSQCAEILLQPLKCPRVWLASDVASSPGFWGSQGSGSTFLINRSQPPRRPGREWEQAMVLWLWWWMMDPRDNSDNRERDRQRGRRMLGASERGFPVVIVIVMMLTHLMSEGGARPRSWALPVPI